MAFLDSGNREYSDVLQGQGMACCGHLLGVLLSVYFLSLGLSPKTQDGNSFGYVGAM